MKLLTIVVPIYNLEKYLPKCLDSLILEDKKQMEMLEVLMINDGSTDNSAEVANKYELQYPGVFKLVNKENGGSGSCRNLGLKMATGLYLRYLDADDWLTNLDRLVQDLQGCKANIVFTAVNIVHLQDGSIEFLPQQKPFGIERSLKEYNPVVNPYWATNFWYATYRTEILQSAYPLFLEKASYVDSILFVAPLILGDSFITYEYPVYNYLDGREGQSMAVSVMSKKWVQRFKAVKHQDNFVATNHAKIFEIEELTHKIVWHEYVRMIDEISTKPLKQYYSLLRLLKKFEPQVQFDERWEFLSERQKCFAKKSFCGFVLYDIRRRMVRKISKYIAKK